MQDPTELVTLAVLAAVVLVLAAAVTVIVRGRRLNRRSGERPGGELQGLSGWLGLLTLGVTLLPVRLARTLLSGYDDLQTARIVPGAVPVFWVESALMAALVALSVLVAVTLWRKQRSFKGRFIALWAALMVFAVVDPVVVGILFDLPWDVVFDRDTLSGIAGNVVAGVWVPYVLRSRRVANTFVR